jgi:hypothetical protein
MAAIDDHATQMGLSPPSATDWGLAALNSVSPMGVLGVSPAAMSFNNYGLSPAGLADLEARGYSGFSAPDTEGMAQTGVDADCAAAVMITRSGYSLATARRAYTEVVANIDAGQTMMKVASFVMAGSIPNASEHPSAELQQCPERLDRRRLPTCWSGPLFSG